MSQAALRIRTILRIASCCGLALLSAAKGAAAQQDVEPCSVAIVGATIIDGRGGEPLKNGVVTIAGNRIAEVGLRREVAFDACKTQFDGRDKFLTPGFIDTNVHIGMPNKLEDFARYYDRIYELAIEGAQLHLKYGVTFVRDSYGVLDPLLKARDAIKEGKAIGADIQVAGNIVGWGGHFSETFRGRPPETFFEEWINDQFTRGSGELLGWKSPDELRFIMNDYIDLGVDFVKIGVTDHNSYSSRLIFSQRQLDVIVETAHERGLMAEVHATSPEGLIMSLDAGVDLIQHPEVILVPISDEALARLDEEDVICSIHGNNHAGKAWREFLRKEEKKKKEKRSEEPPGADGKAGTTLLRAWPEPEETDASKQKELQDAMPRTLRSNAVKILKTRCIITTATDNSMGEPPEFQRNPNEWHAREPGLGTLASIESLVEMGLSPSEAIVAATQNGAKALGRLDEFGTIERGKMADLVMLEKNPLRDISNVHSIHTVIKRGRLVNPDELPDDPVYFRQQPEPKAIPAE